MARRLPPALEAATRDHEVSAAAWRAHRKMCSACTNAIRQERPQLACEPGYRLWQADTRAGHAEARLRAQGDAWGQSQLTLT